MLCKHFDTPKGCVYQDKCQFAHGAQELRSTMNVNFLFINLFTIKKTMFNPTSNINPGQDMLFNNNNNTNKKLPNPANFKIVKCKNFERGIFNYFNNKLIDKFYVFENLNNK